MREPTILRFISIIYRYSQIHIAKKLKSYGIGSGQYPFILAICRSPGISQDGLSEKLVIDKGTTAKSVKTLESAGFLERKIDDADRRAYKLYATPIGQELQGALDTILLEWRDILWKGFSQDERKQVYDLAIRMADNAKNHLART